MSRIRETPLSVGLGLVLHQKICSKKLIDMLDCMNLSNSYEKALSVKKDIGLCVKENMKK